MFRRNPFRRNTMVNLFGPVRYRFGICALLLAVIPAGYAQALTDPTRPAQYRPVAAQERLDLQSILFSDSRKVAVINGKALTEGERIGGARVLSISKDSVRLRRGGKVVRLQLDNVSIRREK